MGTLGPLDHLRQGWRRKKKGEGTKRCVVSNLPFEELRRKDQPNGHYADNNIKTTKYTIWNFIPVNLIEQFHRFANVYFVGIAILNFVPVVNAFQPGVAIIPICIILALTAIKDAWEDFRRYQADHQINNMSCLIYSRKEKDFVVKCWKDVRVGDFVKMVSNETIPADILLLHTSDPNGICHLETANLDGETNLKQRRVVRGISTMSSLFEPENFNSTITCDVPNSKLNQFNGHLDKPDKKKIGFGSESLLLRGCTVRNTDEATGIVVYTGHETKAMLNNNGPRYKRSKLERKMNIDVLSCVVLLFIMCLIGALGHYIWLRTFTGTAPFLIHSSESEYVPPALSGFYTFFTMIILLQVLIPISLYVSIELVKVGQIFFITNDIDLYDDETDHQMQCRALNITEDLGQIQYVFSDKTGTLTENKMVFRRCTIMGTEYSHKENGIRLATHGEMEYDDEEDVCHLRDVPSRFKRKSKGRGTAAIRRCQSTRSYLGAQRWTDVTASPQSEVAFSSPLETDVTPDKQLLRLFCDEDSQFRAWCQVCQPCGGASYMDFFLALVICNTVVLSKTTLPRQELNRPQRFSSSLKSQSRLENLLSKVGSLRQIISSQQTISGQSSQSSQVKPSHSGSPLKEEEIEEEKEEEEGANDITSRNEDRDLCGQGGRDFDVAQVKNSRRETDGLCYEAESPDEAALVYAAKAYGFTLLAHTPDQVTVRLPQGAILTFEVLHTLAFDSTRKRMSVLVRHPFTKQVIMYTKGADSAIMDLLESQAGENQLEERKRKKIASKTQKHLDRYARDGLRTLCIAKKVLSEKTYEDWSALRQEAESAIDNKEEQLMKTAVHLETSFTLLGATGIEDHLQDDVPDTISALREAGIQVWVLTGDKQETAVNIAYSCKLLDKEDQVFVLNTENKDECDSILGCALEEVRRCPESHQSRPFGAGMTVSGPTDVPTPTFGLVIDGRTLSLVFQADLELKFVELTRHCHSVLCCRVTPLQKSSVVQLVRRKLKVMTLAIGDGANDVNMIQAADVGIGISGQEGMQAVMASDFAIPRFKHLKKLLLVHGHWCYSRLANMIVYFFYKNVAYVNLLFWYQFYCGFSGTAMTDYWLLIFFNLFFTSAPPIMFGIMDRDISAETLLGLPELYKCGKKLEGYTRSIFWIAMLDAFYQSLICFFVPYLAYQGSDIDIFSFGIPMNTVSLCTILLHLAIEIKSWTIVHWVIMVGSVVLSFIVTMTYSATCVTCNPPSNPYWIMQKLFSDPVFYLVCVLATVLSLLPRYTLRVFQGILGLSPLIRARQLDRQNPACRDVLIKEWRSATVAHSILPDLPSPVSPVPSSPEPTVHHSQREGPTSSHRPAHRRSISTMTI